MRATAVHGGGQQKGEPGALFFTEGREFVHNALDVLLERNGPEFALIFGDVGLGIL
ncbi:hypothetical protein [Streptomyces endophyticus]|uniref:Uncharacterized protein n=1 Tax=Streptomyces endophyticus TaxID=714166 RepID=A0ABU6FCN7_9ACTN|nr:hypothetical protein [Streptomyces endophyticus]MEB8341799.1 hypothetical protein [Streptomyces endophyticus]